MEIWFRVIVLHISKINRAKEKTRLIAGLTSHQHKIGRTQTSLHSFFFISFFSIQDESLCRLRIKLASSLSHIYSPTFLSTNNMLNKSNKKDMDKIEGSLLPTTHIYCSEQNKSNHNKMSTRLYNNDNWRKWMTQEGFQKYLHRGRKWMNQSPFFLYSCVLFKSSALVCLYSPWMNRRLEKSRMCSVLIA